MGFASEFNKRDFLQSNIIDLCIKIEIARSRFDLLHQLCIADRLLLRDLPGDDLVLLG